LFRNLKIFPLQSNSEIHGINTRYTNNLHYPSYNLTTFQKGSYYFGSRFLIVFHLA
jgi:hypothetical protein